MSRQVALALALLLGGAFYTALAVYVWRRRTSAGGLALFVFLLGILAWSKFYALELGSETVGWAKLFGGLKFVGVVTVPPALWAFVRQYTRRRSIGRRTLALLAVEPVVVLTLLALPATHDLVHSYPPAVEAAGPPFVAVSGPLLWPHAIYSYVLLTVALTQFARRIGRVARPYRREAAVVLVASVVPLVGNALYNLNAWGLGRIDPAPFLFAMFAFVLVWGVFRLRLLDLLPTARGVVVEQMPDGVLVLDVSDRVVDANPAGAALIGVPRPALVGRYVEDVLPNVSELLADHVVGRTSTDEFRLPEAGPNGNGHGSGHGNGNGNGVAGAAAAVDLTVSAWLTSLTDAAGAETGRLLLLRDVSDRTAMEWRLRDLLAEQTRLAEGLQSGLRPPSLPDVPGLRMAARWVPAQGAGRLSGDFYDVHATLGGDHAFVLGDVAGTGVGSAVVTSMVRYTVRTLSAQGWTPQQVLHQLNQALLADQAQLLRQGQDAVDERYCTLVYGRLARLDEGSVGDGVLLTLALAGHPQPFVRHRDGSVEALGRPGTALGLIPSIDVGEVTVHLRPGEVLLAYTDGVTGARCGPEQFGPERLAAILAGTGAGLLGGQGETVAEVVVDAVAERVLGAVREFAARHDDIALVVLAVA